jgi:hypothetical protein
MTVMPSRKETAAGMKLHLDTFSLLDKGRYPMVSGNDRVFVLNSIHACRENSGDWITSGAVKR